MPIPMISNKEMSLSIMAYLACIFITATVIEFWTTSLSGIS
jgi:hypothetical protein